MNAKQAKQIDLIKFINRLSIFPATEKGNNIWYYSPFRIENTPSFKVDKSTNYWYDFGLGKGGTIIDFVSLWEETSNISEILRFIEKNTNAVEKFCVTKINKPVNNLFSFQKQEIKSEREVYISALRNNMLWDYLKQRGISEPYVTNLKQADIIHADKHYLTLAFQNDKGGYELNNKHFKGCTSKALSTIYVNKDKPIFVFEAFIDCLSFWELCKKSGTEALDFAEKSNFLILNSVSLVEQGILALKPYSDIRLFLDNDDAGVSSSQKIMREYPIAKDFSHLYKEYKDLNDFLVKGDKSSFDGLVSRCAIVLTKTNVLSRNGDLAFTPEGRKSERAILPNDALKREAPIKSEELKKKEEKIKPKRGRGLCR